MNLNRTLTRSCVVAVLLLMAEPLWAQQATAVPAVPAATYNAAQNARQLRLQGKPEESAKALRPIASTHPDFFFAQYNLGLAYQGKGDTAAAIAALTKAKEIREKQKIADATIYNSLGWVYLGNGDYQQALREFKTAEKPENFAALTPSSQKKLLNNIAVTYAYSGEAKLANEYFAKAKAIPVGESQAQK